jgi:hypothetical protein
MKVSPLSRKEFSFIPLITKRAFACSIILARIPIVFPYGKISLMGGLRVYHVPHKFYMEG